MSIRVNVKIEGGEELLRALKEMGVDVDAQLEAAAKAGAEQIRAAANDAAPGPHVEMEVVESRKGQAKVNIGPDKEHWFYRFFETGTAAHEIRPSSKAALLLRGLGENIFAMIARPSGMGARPFLRPAFDEKQGAAEDAVGETLRKVIEK